MKWSRIATSLLLILMLMLPLSQPSSIALERYNQSMFDEENQTTNDINRSELLASLPIWSIGDSWTYAVSLDAVSLVEEAETLDGASLDILTGTATRTITAIYESSVNGYSPEYIVSTILGASGTGVFPQGPVDISGDLLIGMTEVMRVRVSDLAIVHISRDFDIDFSAGPIQLDMADVIENTSYLPSYEFYDFPIRESDVHFLSLERTTSWDGDGLVSFPEDPVVNNTERETQPAKKVESSLVSYPCPSQSISIAEKASDGVLVEEHHYCPDVKNDVYWYTEDVGLNGVKGTFNLLSYSAAGTTPGTQLPPEVIVELGSDDIGKELPLNVSVSTRSSDGSSTSRTIHLYTMDEMIESSTSDGELVLSINSTTLEDSTVSVSDWSSHAIIACIGHAPSTLTYTACGATEITIQGSAMGKVIREETISEIVNIIGDFSISTEQATRLIRL
ncbi:MAG: hypothetical protein VXW89_00320 [Candidatus Thermoplasmatota archaeon]|nr:hypothetical protein [Candidatus Thermoplasmatota archaeon]MEC7544058.1 hypothetical protein [Candidatus Thermoplasmatota archaeon]MED5374997.1 hypothetical protein [Candidatus Thermoplasmatota archaeon]